MRTFALILAACAASTLNWSCPVHAEAPIASAPAERLPHISIQEIGKGLPVVLIPGLSSPREVWDATIPALARDHRMILVQVNGFGGDDPGANLKPGILDGIVADLHGWLTAHKVAPAKIVGHSMGGLVALMLAKAHPGDTGAVMTVDALPYVGDIFVPGAPVAQLEPQAKAMRGQTVAGFGKPNPANAAIARGMALTPAAQEKVTGWMAKADSRVSGQAMYEDLATDLRPDMATIATPITLVMPYSAAMPKERAEAFYRAEYAKAPNLTVVPIGESGHFVMLDQPERFAEAIDAFAR